MPAPALPALTFLLTEADVSDLQSEAPADLAAVHEWMALSATTSRVDPLRWTPGQGAAPPDGVVALFSGVPLLTAGPALTVGRDLPLSGPNGELPFTLGSRRYTLRWSSRAGDGCDTRIELSSGRAVQTVYDAAKATGGLSCDEPHLTVAWAGDVDRDGRLDLIAAFSPKYSHHPRALLLSSAAGDGELVREVARSVRLAR